MFPVDFMSIYILFPQLYYKIINDKVCLLEKPLHPPPKKKTPANMSVWPLESAHK